MASRMDKYDDNANVTRSQRNKDIYNNVRNSSYFNYEKLPVSDNIDEIDISTLKKIATNRDDYRKLKKLEDTIKINKEEIKTEVPDSEDKKIYDINELIEKARKEKEKLQTVQKKIIDTNYNFLNTLESSQIYKDIQQEKEKELEKLEKTRQFKFQTERLNDNPTIEQILADTAKLSLDILSDLRPSDNTIVTKPIEEEKNQEVEETGEVKSSDFYSGTYDFSKKDFMSLEKFEKPGKKHTGLKILIVIITIIVIVLAVIFALNYFDVDIIKYLKK